MIDKGFGKYFLVCDACGESTDFDTWEEAKDAKKVFGYSSEKEGEKWIDLCPICKEA